MLHIRLFARFLTLFAFFLVSGTVQAQASCDVFGKAVFHLNLDTNTQVQGSNRVVSPAVRGNGLAIKSNTVAYVDSFPLGSSNNFSVGLWVKPERQAHNQGRFISMASAVEPGAHDFMISANAYTAIRYRLRLGNVTHEIASRTGLLQTNVWSHITVAYNGAYMTMFHNGVVVARKAVTGQLNFRNFKTGLGNQPPGAGNRQFGGMLDQIVVFNRAFNADLAKALYSNRGLGCGTQFNRDARDSAKYFPDTGTGGAATQASAPAQNIVQITPSQNNTALSAQPAVFSSLPVDNSDAWPAFNDKLPLGGVFYGMTKAGLSSGNGPLAYQNAIRFRAQRTGIVKAIRYNNRTLSTYDINSRCAAGDSSSVWCKCVSAGLDERSCGFTLSNSYHVGNGGLITIEVKDNDNSPNNFPGSRLLGRSRAYTPISIESKFPTIQLINPIYLEAGKIYHIIFRNDRPPINCKLRALTPAQAKTCDRNRGAMGINGTTHATDPSSLHPLGPFLGTAGSGILTRKTTSSTWQESEGVVPFYELQYDDGTYLGETYAGYDTRNNFKSKGTHFIDGSIRARQAFTVEDATRRANGLWLNYGHSQWKASNGRPLKVELKNSVGTVLATGTLAASPKCSKLAVASFKNRQGRQSRNKDWMCRVWGYTNLSRTIGLVKGRKYYVEFSAPAGAAYALSTYFSYHRLQEKNNWANARAEISSNNGRNWSEWSGTQYYTTRDLPVLFTLQGMPKQLP